MSRRPAVPLGGGHSAEGSKEGDLASPDHRSERPGGVLPEGGSQGDGALSGAAGARTRRDRLAAIRDAWERFAEEGEQPARTSTPALIFALVLVAAVAVIVLFAGYGKSPLLPPSPNVARWMKGIAGTLTFQVFLICLLVFSCAYLGLIATARKMTPRVAIALVAVLNLIVFVGPILISTDVFSYIAYARMAVIHHIDPYVHGPRKISGDPIYKYVGRDWVKSPSAYGPLYTIISFPIAPLGLKASIWAMKLEALAGSAVACWLTWRCARQRRLNPVPALLIVGANPLWVIYGLGGAHNDLIMIAFMMGAVTMALAGNDARSGALIIAGAFIKATAIAMLPFMAIGRRRSRLLLGAGACLVCCVAVGFVLFGPHGVDIVTILRKDSSYVSSDGFPTVFMHLLGNPGVFPVDHILLTAGLALILLYVLWRTWRGLDWVAGAGWALLAIAVTSPWLLAWYTLWGLPLSVTTRDRRLLAAVIVIQVLYIVHQTSPLFSPVS